MRPDKETEKEGERESEREREREAEAEAEAEIMRINKERIINLEDRHTTRPYTPSTGFLCY